MRLHPRQNSGGRAILPKEQHSQVPAKAGGD
jgi:hypothetical protein